MTTTQVEATHPGRDISRGITRWRMLLPGLLMALLLLVGYGALAQTLTQTFTLQNGWNAIHLEVTPSDGNPASLFADLPVASVWTRVDKLSSVDFIQDPTEPAFNEADWLKWNAPPDPPFLNDLRELQGNRAYLVKLTNGPVTWQVTGKLAVHSIPWVTDAWNLRGFPVSSVHPPTFRSYFQPSTNHYNQAQDRLWGVYRLGADGAWALADADAAMRAGEACWVYCQGASSYTAPLELSPESGETLDFGQTLGQINLKFNNWAPGVRTVTLAQAGSPVPGLLAYRHFDATNGFEWADLPNPFTVVVTNGASRSLTLGFRRSRMPSTNYASILYASDEEGTRQALPMLAERFGLDYAGLWVGQVTVDAVSEPHFGSLTTNLYALVNGQATPLNDANLIVTTNWLVTTNTDLVVVTNELLDVQTTSGDQVPVYEKVERSTAEPLPTATHSEFAMRLLMHVDRQGQARLLKEVVQMWRDGTWRNVPGGGQTVDKPGTYVLVTEDELLSQFKGATLRDGALVGKRLSAVGFDFDGQGTNHMALTGAFAPGNALVGTIQVAADYPLNPFRHKYHPDHDNLDAAFNPISEPARQEAYAVTRQLRFDFASGSSGSATGPDPTYSAMEGVYRETLTGLHKQPIHVQGTFRLSRASHIAELNPSPIP